MQINPAWIANHTADPVVLKGSYPGLDGHVYPYALYFTADDGGGTLGNVIGLSLSDDGIHWIPFGDGPIIRSDGNSHGQRYEVGMNTVAWDPINKQYVSIIFDSEVQNGLTLRTSRDGMDWRMEYPAAYLPFLSFPDKDRGIKYCQGPDLAWCQEDGHWYAAVKCDDENGTYDGRSIILRSHLPGDLTGQWDIIRIIDRSVTGQLCNHNPCFSRTGSGQLYVDDEGCFYCFFGMGNTSMDGEISIGACRIPPLSAENPPVKQALFLNLCDDAAGRYPLPIDHDTWIGQHFHTEKPWDCFLVNCPSFHNNIGSVSVSIYSWKEDCAASIASSPLAQQRFVDFKDNAQLRIFLKKALPAGDYLAVLEDIQPDVGVWMHEKAGQGQCYLNGKAYPGGFEARVLYV